MKSLKVIVPAVSLLIASHAYAETKVMSALDVALGGADLNGQNITVQGCTIWLASLSGMLCGVRDISGSRVGNIYVDARNMDRADLRSALRCRSFAGDCKASITGKIRVYSIGDLNIDGKKIHWH